MLSSQFVNSFSPAMVNRFDMHRKHVSRMHIIMNMKMQMINNISFFSLKFVCVFLDFRC